MTSQHPHHDDDRGAMTEATERDEHEHQPEDERRGGFDERVLDGDPDLISVVQMVDAFGLEQPVVLTLAGQVLAGTLVSHRVHFAGLAKVIQGQDPDETFRGALAGRFRRRGEDLADWGSASKLGDLDPDAPAADDLPPMPSVEYLHLRDATVVTSPPSGLRMPLWRGRIADVVGWTAGDLEDVPADD
jgi:hypothetical protein